MDLKELTEIYASHPAVEEAVKWLKTQKRGGHLCLPGLFGSSRAMALACLFKQLNRTLLVVLENSDEAVYFYSDLKAAGADAILFPTPYINRKKTTDGANEIARTEVMNWLANDEHPCVVVSSPDALKEPVAAAERLQQLTLRLKVGQTIQMKSLTEQLVEYGFTRVDFVYEPGQFSLRGSVVDIYSYASEDPYRIDFFGDDIDSIRLFDIESQLSKQKVEQVDIVGDLADAKQSDQEQHLLLDYLPQNAIHVLTDYLYTRSQLEGYQPSLSIELGPHSSFPDAATLSFKTAFQQNFHKNFDLLSQQIRQWQQEGYSIYILSDSKKQTDRIQAIFDDREEDIQFTPVLHTLHEGFVDHDLSLVFLTDHQIFERFHKVPISTDKARQGKVIMTLKELNDLHIGDYVVHVDHGIGRFGGLVRTPANGTMQEMVKLTYKDGDTIFVSIHALHRISKYKGKDGEEPRIHKLGNGAWERLKERTKEKVKDIARDLIMLYAKRKQQKGFAFSDDSYLQKELEASFLYEDTPDQQKATIDLKHDMESQMPMDRLVCGDVGFGKTEVAMRAAFKAVNDRKQVAVLVPTTVLALQHYHSFSQRFKDYPVVVEYLTRARTAQETKKILERLASGDIDVLIGTHRLVSKTVKWKDLGLLIIDEEQKFGVATKEKLRQTRVNVDTLTLSATPIPRTLQMSLLGARDLSVIQTPPPNRFPVQTEVLSWDDEEVVREALNYEIGRNGQIFVINDRIQGIETLENRIKRLCPECRIAVGHGQMAPEKLEQILTDFVNYEYDVLIATSIIESGVDMPNVNTIIINNANHFGLSDLHQMRGRVGRSNRKAFCYLLAPPPELLTPEARRRLKAIESFTDLGSGYNIALQDLDIRGAGNMLGAEQSGFIADLGYETYQKILNEAVLELKEEEFSELYAYQRKQEESLLTYVTDCQLETDLDLGFPFDYIQSTSDRISLYRELDSLTTMDQLRDYKLRLTDRFGRFPEKGEELLEAMQMRWIAMRYGIEKMTLKNGRMILHLVSNQRSDYYQSDRFGQLLQYCMRPNNLRNIEFRQQEKGNSILIKSITCVHEAFRILSEMENS